MERREEAVVLTLTLIFDLASPFPLRTCCVNMTSRLERHTVCTQPCLMHITPTPSEYSRAELHAQHARCATAKAEGPRHGTHGPRTTVGGRCSAGDETPRARPSTEHGPGVQRRTGLYSVGYIHRPVHSCVIVCLHAKSNATLRTVLYHNPQTSNSNTDNTV